MISPIVSIVICTRNRAESLKLTLQSIAACETTADLPVEVLVVDNGSTDHTPRVVVETKLPNICLRYFRQSVGAKTAACNRALREADGDIFLFTDDDVRLPTRWIDGMCRPIADNQADAIAGGVVFPHDLDIRAKINRSWLAATEEIEPQKPQRFVGANMAFSRSVLSRVPEFDNELGPGALGFGEETLFCMQLIRAGFRVQSRFDVAAEHHFDPSRLTRRGMIDMAKKMGRSEAYISYHWRHVEFSWPLSHELAKLRVLWGGRLREFSRCYLARETPFWELERIQAAAFRNQYRREQRRPRLYDKLGLIKTSKAA